MHQGKHTSPVSMALTNAEEAIGQGEGCAVGRDVVVATCCIHLVRTQVSWGEGFRRTAEEGLAVSDKGATRLWIEEAEVGLGA